MFDRLGDALTVLRLLRRLSQAELAERAGIRPNQISRYETGAVQPQLAQLERLLDALAIGLPEFVYVLSTIERFWSMIAAADSRGPAEVVAASAAAAYWLEMADRHIRIATDVSRLVPGRFGTG